ncbi:MAG: tetratricopeptide repeat protein [Armatimonadota bacterium]
MTQQDFDEEDPPARLSPELLRAEKLMDVEKWGRALREIRLALAQDPDNDHARLLAGTCYSQLGQHDNAQREAEYLIRINPHQPAGYALAAAIANDRQQYQDGLRLIDQALELFPEYADFHALKALMLCDSGQPEQALRSAEEALRIEPENYEADHARIMALTALGRHQETELGTLQALAHKPENAISWYQRGAQCLVQGRIEEARAAYQEALRLDPEMAEAQRGLLQIEGMRHPYFRPYWSFVLWAHNSPGAKDTFGNVFGVVVTGSIFLFIFWPPARPYVISVAILLVIMILYLGTAGLLFDIAIDRRRRE